MEEIWDSHCVLVIRVLLKNGEILKYTSDSFRLDEPDSGGLVMFASPSELGTCDSVDELKQMLIDSLYDDMNCENNPVLTEKSPIIIGLSKVKSMSEIAAITVNSDAYNIDDVDYGYDHSTYYLDQKLTVFDSQMEDLLEDFSQIRADICSDALQADHFGLYEDDGSQQGCDREVPLPEDWEKRLHMTDESIMERLKVELSGLVEGMDEKILYQKMEKAREELKEQELLAKQEENYPESAADLDLAENRGLISDKIQSYLAGLNTPVHKTESEVLDGCTIANGVLRVYNWNETEVRIPDGIRVIAKDAFCFRKLETVVIPESVTDLEDGAFSYCSDLKKAVIPRALKKIVEKRKVFIGCGKLKEIEYY